MGAQRISRAPNVNSPHERLCISCRKTFSDLKSYQNHLKSWKHFQVADQKSEYDEGSKLVETAAFLEGISQDDKQPDNKGEAEISVVHFVPSTCLFCTDDCQTLEDNLEHMQKQHGMFIPDPEYLIDLETFIGYLFTIISEFNECLYCGHIKHTAEGVQRHMLDKGHCKLKAHRDIEYEEFYDFSTSDKEELHKRRGKSLEAAKSLDSTALQIRLESGASIGHRSQVRSHRLNPHRHDKSTERRAITAIEDHTTANQAKERAHQGRQLVSRVDGGLGMIGVSDLQKRSLRAVEKKMLGAEIRARNQYRAAVEKIANKQKVYKVSQSRA